MSALYGIPICRRNSHWCHRQRLWAMPLCSPVPCSEWLSRQPHGPLGLCSTWSGSLCTRAAAFLLALCSLDRDINRARSPQQFGQWKHTYCDATCARWGHGPKKPGKAGPVLKTQNESCLIISPEINSAKEDHKKIGISQCDGKIDMLDLEFKSSGFCRCQREQTLHGR